MTGSKHEVRNVHIKQALVYQNEYYNHTHTTSNCVRHIIKEEWSETWLNHVVHDPPTTSQPNTTIK